MKNKPPVGDPCNGCGGCCLRTLCPLGAAIFGHEKGPCPALETVNHIDFECGLVVHPEKYNPMRTFVVGRAVMSNAAALLVGVGVGCDAFVDGEDTDEMKRELKARWKRLGLAPNSWAVKNALRVWQV
jgi:hypothetical protein